MIATKPGIFDFCGGNEGIIRHLVNTALFSTIVDVLLT
jgi:hypothetical protein